MGLFCLGQHRALVAVQKRLGLDERLMAFLDNVNVSCKPDKVVPIFHILRHELWSHSRIQIHLEMTQILNKCGVEPPSWHRLAADARMSDRDAIVWRGDHTLPPERQGSLPLGLLSMVLSVLLLLLLLLCVLLAAACAAFAFCTVFSVVCATFAAAFLLFFLLLLLLPAASCGPPTVNLHLCRP